MKSFYCIFIATVLMVTFAIGQPKGNGCSWEDGYYTMELYWTSWGSIPAHAREVTHIVRGSRYLNRNLKVCLTRRGDGMLLDSILDRIRLAKPLSRQRDVTVVAIVRKPNKKDTISFNDTRSVEINGTCYPMSRELFEFIAVRMTYIEASRMLPDTIRFVNQNKE